jgi:prepilin-type N-terminal cleavage/methylation domain-containing protein
MQMIKRDYCQQGFTLVEIAIVLVIVGLLLGGGITLLSSASDTSRYKETQNTMQDIKDALVTYSVVNRHLPCPDTDMPADGIENPPVWTGVCANNRGFLPFATLGIGGNGDAWGEQIKYIVSPPFAASAALNFCTTYSVPPNGRNTAANQVTIQDLQVAPAVLGDWAAFALVSTGKNGRQTNAGMAGSFTNDGGCLALDAREQENCDTDSVLRYGNQMTDGTSVTFDDIVVWVGDYQLMSEYRKSLVCN